MDTIYLGWHSGSFKADDGKTVNFKKVFLAVPIEPDPERNYSGFGYKVRDCRLRDIGLVAGLKQFTPVEVNFDSYGRIKDITPTADYAQPSA